MLAAARLPLHNRSSTPEICCQLTSYFCAVDGLAAQAAAAVAVLEAAPVGAVAVHCCFFRVLESPCELAAYTGTWAVHPAVIVLQTHARHSLDAAMCHFLICCGNPEEVQSSSMRKVSHTHVQKPALVDELPLPSQARGALSSCMAMRRMLCTSLINHCRCCCWHGCRCGCCGCRHQQRHGACTPR
jgi:hypothetical protein